MRIILETTCQEISIDEFSRLTENARPASYNYLLKLIKKDYPDFYYNLGLHLFNPYFEHTQQTKTHYILVHSAIEYFFKKHY